MLHRRWWLVAVAATLVATGAGLTAPTGAAVGTPAGPLNGLGRAVAQALADPSQRAWLRAEMDASPYVEHRVPLKRVLTAGSGGPQARAILDRTGFGAATASVVAALPELELYLAIEQQRSSWRGEGEVDVAVRQPDESYVVFSADGTRRAVPWNHHPGARVTLTLAPSEIDYADPASALRGGPRTGDAMVTAPAPAGEDATLQAIPCDPTCTPPPPPPPPPVDATRHTAMQHFRLYQDHEGAFGGSNEIEIFGSINGTYYPDCGRVTNISTGHWYYFPPGTPNTTLARAVPASSSRFAMSAYEDDDGGCLRRSGDDWLGGWSPGIFAYQYGNSFLTSAPGHLSLAVGAVARFE